MSQRTSSVGGVGVGNSSGGRYIHVPFRSIPALSYSSFSFPPSLPLLSLSPPPLSFSVSPSHSLSPSFQLLLEEPASRSPQRSRFPRFELPSSHRRRRRRLPSFSSCYFSSSFSSSARACRGSGDRYGPIYFRSRCWSHVYERKGAFAELCSLFPFPSLPPFLSLSFSLAYAVETFDFYDTIRASSRAHRCSSFVPRIGLQFCAPISSLKRFLRC